MVKIIEIENVYDVENEESWSSMDGYKITTEEGYYQILIGNSQSCCESWGYFTSEDDTNEFIGSELFKVEIVDKAYNKKKYDEVLSRGLDSGDIVFVNFETSNGTLQFAAYNAHNGYYGHTAIVEYVSNGEREVMVDTYL